MFSIFKREFKSYFNSMIGYIFTALLTFFIGLYFSLINVLNGYPYFGVILLNIIFIFMFAFPILTMRSMAEERKTKTDQLLLTSPVSVTGMVLGKFFAMVAVYAIPVLLACLCPLIMLLRSNNHTASDLCALIPFLLLGCVYISIGMYISSLTESQIIAAVITIGAFIMLYLSSSLVAYYPTSAIASLIGFFVLLILLCIVYYVMSKNLYVTGMIGLVGILVLSVIYALNSTIFEGAIPAILNQLTLTEPLDNFAAYYVFDLSGIIYYLSIIFLFCFLTIQSVQKRRWS